MSLDPEVAAGLAALGTAAGIVLGAIGKSIHTSYQAVPHVDEATCTARMLAIVNQYNDIRERLISIEESLRSGNRPH